MHKHEFHGDSVDEERVGSGADQQVDDFPVQGGWGEHSAEHQLRPQLLVFGHPTELAQSLQSVQEETKGDECFTARMLELRNKCSKEGGDQLQVHRGEPAEQGEHVLCFARNAYTRWSILFVVLFECIF